MAQAEVKSRPFTQLTHETADGKQLVVESRAGDHLDIYLEDKTTGNVDSVTLLHGEKAALRSMLMAALNATG